MGHVRQPAATIAARRAAGQALQCLVRKIDGWNKFIVKIQNSMFFVCVSEYIGFGLVFTLTFVSFSLTLVRPNYSLYETFV